MPNRVGLTVVYDHQPPKPVFRWQDVDEIRTYKADCWNHDDIRLVFAVGERWYNFSEECPGFSALSEEMKVAFPDIPENWFREVMLPPFAANERTLYRRP